MKKVFLLLFVFVLYVLLYEFVYGPIKYDFLCNKYMKINKKLEVNEKYYSLYKEDINFIRVNDKLRVAVTIIPMNMGFDIVNKDIIVVWDDGTRQHFVKKPTENYGWYYPGDGFSMFWPAIRPKGICKTVDGRIGYGPSVFPEGIDEDSFSEYSEMFMNQIKKDIVTIMKRIGYIELKDL